MAETGEVRYRCAILFMVMKADFYSVSGRSNHPVSYLTAALKVHVSGWAVSYLIWSIWALLLPTESFKCLQKMNLGFLIQYFLLRGPSCCTRYTLPHGVLASRERRPTVPLLL